MENENILKEMGIPTEPIVEEQPVQQETVAEPVVTEPVVEEKPSIENITFDLPNMENTNVNPVNEVVTSPIEDVVSAPIEEPVSQSINPGFMDVDKIEATAENVYKEEAPLADIDKLLDTSNNPKTEEVVSPFQPVENAASMKEEVAAQEATNDDVPTPVPGGGKFFTMFAREEDTNPNFVKDIEGTEVNMDFKEEPVTPSFNFDTPSINPVQEEPENKPEPQINPSQVFTMAQEAPAPELEKTNDFTQTFKPFSLNDEDSFLKTEPEEPESPFDKEVPKMQPITFDDMGEIEVKLPEQEKETVDLKTVINTIRECAAQIERFGFTIDTDEIDLPDSYQVTFKIDKN